MDACRKYEAGIAAGLDTINLLSALTALVETQQMIMAKQETLLTAIDAVLEMQEAAQGQEPEEAETSTGATQH